MAEAAVGLAVRVRGLFDYRDRRLLDVPLQWLERPAQLAGDFPYFESSHTSVEGGGVRIAYATTTIAVQDTYCIRILNYSVATCGLLVVKLLFAGRYISSSSRACRSPLARIRTAIPAEPACPTYYFE